MSTLKVAEIRNASSATGGLSIAADGVVSGALPYPNRNLLYNGAMQVHQRGTSTTGITTDGYYTADRWNMGVSSLGTWTETVENDAPTGSGLRKSLKVLCTTADAAPAASDILNMQQRIEGQDLQRIAKGTASAQKITLSFWVKSNVTGTYVAELFDIDNTRQTSIAYTINASATWEKKTITFAADTAGALDNDNATSLQLTFWLAAGSDRTSGTLQSSWAANTNANRAVGQTNLAAATNNYWQITGVQLETGPVATPFEFEPYEATLRKCQRYYYRIVKPSANAYPAVGFASSTTLGRCIFNFPTTMRALPTALETSGVAGDYALLYKAGASNVLTSVPTFISATEETGWVDATISSAPLVAGEGLFFRIFTNSAYLAWSAEL